MQEEYGYNDEKFNQFKLMIYNWNINNAIKYYYNDSFCCDYCIDDDDEYGCKKQNNQCAFEHSQTFNLNMYLVIHNMYNKIINVQNYCVYI